MKRMIIGVVAALLVSGNALVYSADSLVQGFNSAQTLQPGLVVALNKDSPRFVEAAPDGDSSRIYGVVIDPSSAPATVADTGQDVFVATSGRYPVLVSVENGGVGSRDYLSISTTSGIAAKATAEQTMSLGRALEKFEGRGGGLPK